MKTNDKLRRSGGRSGRKSAFWSGALALGAVGVSAQSVKAQDAGDLASIESTRVQPDGSLSVVLSDGRSLSLSPDEYEIVDGTVVIDPPVAEALGLAGSGSGLSLPLLGGGAAGVAALAGGAAALAGGGDSGGSGAGGSANEAPVFTSEATASVAENTAVETTVYTPVVTDADGDTLTFTLSGTDAALFDIDAGTGVVTFKPDHLPDYENPGDTDGGNDYDIVITASDGTHSTDQAVTITVTNVNDEAPVFTSGATASVAENTAVETAVYTPIVTDADGDTLEFTLSGTDAALFDIVPETGVVTFKAAPDFETPGDAGGNNVYDIVITANDGTHSTDQAVTITVTDVAGDDEPPVFTSGATASVAENTAVETAVYTPTVTDADGGTLTFSISDGADAALFDIVPETGVVTFKAAPDFENPGDADGNNVYDIVITANDGTNSTDQAVTITVTDVANDEAPVFTSGATASVAENTPVETAVYTPIVTDADGGTLTFTLSGVDAALFDIVPETGVVRFKAAPDFENPGDAGGNNDYDIVITASDGTNSTDQAVTITVTDENDEAPVFTSGATASVAENTPVETAVYTPTVTDADGGPLTFTLSGADAALFDIVPGTGVVTFKAAPDFENPGDAGGNNVYDIVITASDGTNSTDQAVTITVTDVEVEPASVLDLSDISTTEGVIIQGDVAGDQAGVSVSSAGDVNGDGFEDLIVGAPLGDDGGYNAGEAYVIYGGTGLANIDLSDLTVAQGFIIQGDAERDLAGFSVSSAGDVNGDGFDDLIVGARLGDDGGNDAGEAYVIYGGTELTNIDLSDLTVAQGFIIQGDGAGDWAGSSVSSAGDVNGDGFDDLIVGAPWGNDDGNNVAGEAYVLYGGTGLTNIDLTGLTSDQGFIIQGDDGADAQAGRSVSSAGDVNGDGFDDLIVGAPFGDEGGKAYVLYGGTGLATIDLATLTTAQGFIIQGDAQDDQAGRSVSSAGDVNGDGFDDLIVGAPFGDEGGEAYVLYGGTGLVNIDLTGLTSDQGFIIQGDAEGDWAGYSVSSAGDVNGDGFDDLIVGAHFGDDGGIDAGEAYVLYGGTGLANIDLTNLTVDQGFIIQGDAAGDRAGHSVSSAGDVNDDGFDDLIVGAFYGNDGGERAGEAYVIYGGATGTESTLAVTRAGTDGVADNFTGNAGNDTFTGIGANDVVRGGAGDDSITLTSLDFAKVDGGHGDDTLVLGGSGLTLDLTGARTDVESFETIDLTGTGDNTLVIDALSLLDLSGDTADGVTTLDVIGTTGDKVTLGGTPGDWAAGGQVTEGGVTFNTFTTGNAVIRVQDGVSVERPAQVLDLSDITTAEGIIIRGDEANDQAGFSVSSAGDVNGDGFEDLIVGAPFGDDGGIAAGEAYVLYGGTGLVNIDLSTLTAAQGFIIQGDAEIGRAGWSVSSAGDVNGDGFDDVIVGAPLGGDGAPNAGEAYVIYGGTGLANIDLGGLTSNQGFIIQGDTAVDRAGHSVSSAGDVNGDGFDDLIVGARLGDDGGTNAGEAYVLYGGTELADIDLANLTVAQGFIIQGDKAFDQAGASVSSAGDVNGDGFDDLIIGAHLGDDGGNDAGEAYVIYGGTGLANIDLSTLTADQGFIIQGDGAVDWAGRSVSSAGDVNGDGFDDLIVGARLGDDGGTDAGEAYVLYGGTELADIDLTNLTVAQGFIIQGDAEGDQAGFSVSSAGDVNGDGYDDLIVGAHFGDDGGIDAGEAYVIYGGTGLNGAGLANIDLSTLTADQGFIIQGDAADDQAGRSVSSAGDVNGDGFDDLIVGAPRGDDGGPNAGEAYVLYGGATGTESTLAVTRAGTDGVADNFTGNAGNDIFTGIGADDVVRGGAGDDSVTLTDLNFAKVDGGHGYDTLVLGGSGMTLDLTGARTDVESFETIDLTGTGDNTLVIDALSLFDLSGDTANGITTFKVTGDTGDQVTLTDTGWSADGQRDEDGVTFDVYANGQAEIWIEEAVTVTASI